jgi:hypothetical protein
VLLLDADNCPVRNAEFLFTTPQYREHGAIFWPDYSRFAKAQAVWLASGIPYCDEPEFESGQIVVDKARCWRALNVAMHLNEHSEWWYRVVHGDKDTFHLAWRKIGQPYAMPRKGVKPLEATMLQHDFAGRLLFQHRNFAKWKLHENRRIPGFRLEKECLRFLATLRRRLAAAMPQDLRRWDARRADPATRAIARALCSRRWSYARMGMDARPMRFLPDGTVGEGAASCERWWNICRPDAARGRSGALRIEVSGDFGLTFHARCRGRAEWRGAWVIFERTAVVLKPLAKAPAMNGKGHS